LPGLWTVLKGNTLSFPPELLEDELFPDLEDVDEEELEDREDEELFFRYHFRLWNTRCKSFFEIFRLLAILSGFEDIISYNY